MLFEPPIHSLIYEEALHALTTVLPNSHPGKDVNLTLKLGGEESDPKQDRPYMAVYDMQQHLARALRIESSGLAERLHAYGQTARIGGVVVERFLFVPSDSAAPRRFSMKGFKNAAIISY